MALDQRSKGLTERNVEGGALALGAGLLLLGLNDTIAEAVAAILPGRMRVRSAGSVFRSFEQLAPYSIGIVGAAFVMAGVLLLAQPELAGLTGKYKTQIESMRSSNRWLYGSVASVLVVAFVFSLYLAYPHNAGPHDSRIHWTDFHLSRRYNYWYTWVRIRIPFTNHPSTFQAVNIVVNVWLLWYFLAKFTKSRWLSLGLASTLAFAPNLITFSDTAEDVHLSLTALIIALIAGRSRRPWVLALVTVFAISARPPFLALIGAYSVAEVARHITGEHDTSLFGRLAGAFQSSWKFIVHMMLWFVLFFGLYQIAIDLLGDRWVFTNGRLIDSNLLDIEPITVGGFTIFAFSGAYVTHLFWVLPLPLVLAAFVSPWLYRRFTPEQAYFAALSVSFVLAQLFILEYFPLLTFDARYLVYLWPFLVVAGWASVAVLRARLSRTMGAVLLAVFMLSPLLIPFDALADRNQRLSRTPTELVQNADVLRSTAARATGYALYGGTVWEGNALTWVYSDWVQRFDPATDVALKPGWTLHAPLIHEDRLDAEASLRPVAQLERFVVYTVVESVTLEPVS